MTSTVKVLRRNELRNTIQILSQLQTTRASHVASFVYININDKNIDVYGIRWVHTTKKKVP
jgi:hypothetical protein